LRSDRSSRARIALGPAVAGASIASIVASIAVLPSAGSRA
jgi:hypothetical protein